MIRNHINKKERQGTKMNAKERVIKAINGEELTEIPSCFSLHFPEGCGAGEEGVSAHRRFFEETDTDICKIMNENLIPYCEGISCGSDYGRLPSFDLESGFMKKQIELVKRILDVSDPDKFMMGTLHGVVACGIHPIEKKYGYDGSRLAMTEHFRQDRDTVLDAYKRITEGMCLLAEKYIELGLDAVYYAALGGEYRYYTDEEFAEYFEPLDKQILQTIKSTKGYCFLHICKDRLNMKRYRDYGDYADVVNWGVYEAPFRLEEGREMFPGKTIMGGLANRSGVLVDGTDEEIAAEVKQVISRFGKKGFILGADCTLPTEIDYRRIRAAVEAARQD